jgi:hypothetical protein
MLKHIKINYLNNNDELKCMFQDIESILSMQKAEQPVYLSRNCYDYSIGMIIKLNQPESKCDKNRIRLSDKIYFYEPIKNKFYTIRNELAEYDLVCMGKYFYFLFLPLVPPIQNIII